MDFKYFTGNIDSGRKLERDERTGFKYKNAKGDTVELNKEELDCLRGHYKAQILRRLWQRDRASNHFRWVSEPTLRVSALRLQSNSYRDPARRKAADWAYESLMKDNYIQEFQSSQPDIPGADPIRVHLTNRGSAWLMAYDRWFMNERGRRFLEDPKWHQFVDEEGFDKHESTRARKVRALKKVEYV